MARAQLPRTTMDRAEWTALCEWLDGIYRKAAYRDSFPFKWQHVLTTSGHAMEQRERAGMPIFYAVGWGWRLHRDWRERLAAATFVEQAELTDDMQAQMSSSTE